MLINSKTMLSLLATALICLGNETAYAACTYPNQLLNGQVADASALTANLSAIANCIDDGRPAGVANTLQYNSGASTFAAVGPLSNGQTIIGATGSAPQASTLTAGPGIAISNMPGGVTISANGGGGGGVDWLNASAVVQPSVGTFTLRTSTTPPTGAGLSATNRGILLSSAGFADATGIMAAVAAPTGHWQATMLAVYTGPLTNYNLPSIAVRDATNNKAVEFGIGGNGANTYRFAYRKTSGGVGLDTYAQDSFFQDIGFPPPSEPIWSRLTFDGTSLLWAFSRDGEHFVPSFTVAAHDYLPNLSEVGPASMFAVPGQATWATGLHVLSWNVIPI